MGYTDSDIFHYELDTASRLSAASIWRHPCSLPTRQHSGKYLQPPSILKADTYNSSASPLLKLPPELRNHIYSYVFQSAICYNSPDGRRRCMVVDNLSLNQTCRQIHSETAGLLNKFTVLRLHDSHGSLDSWINHRHGRSHTLLMPRIVFCFIYHARILPALKFVPAWRSASAV